MVTPALTPRAPATTATWCNKYGSGRARVGWAERIGKKYYWILLQQLVGQLSDHLEQTEFDEPVKQPSEPPLQELALRDIDPTDVRVHTPISGGEWYLSQAYTFNTRWNLAQQEWLSFDDFPEPMDFLTVQDNQGVLWTPLHLSKRWEASQESGEDERYPRRSVALLLQSALIKKEHLADLEHSLRQTEFDPDIYDLCMEEYQGYLAEYPYGAAYRHRFETGELRAAYRMHRTPVYLTTACLLREFEYDYSDGPDWTLHAPGLIFALKDRLTWDGNGGWARGADRVFLNPRGNGEDSPALLVRQDYLNDFLDEWGLALLWTVFRNKSVIAERLDGGIRDVRGAIVLEDGTSRVLK